MKKILLAALAIGIFSSAGNVEAAPSISPTLYAYTYRVRGYSRKGGTYVAPYYRTSPDRYKWNNRSYRW
jgi:hypothetical protein